MFVIALDVPPGGPRTAWHTRRAVWLSTEWSISCSMRRQESGSKPVAREWAGYTPDGQLLVVTREADLWIVTSGAGEPVRHHLLDLALIEAIRADVRAHSIGIDYGEWTRLIADNILSTWPRSD
jgi:hypothetical protein